MATREAGRAAPPDRVQELVSDLRYLLGALWFRRPLYAAVLESVPIIATRRVPVAAVDLEALLVNPDTVMELELPVRAAVLLHEALHKVLRHPSRMKALAELLAGQGYDPRAVRELFNYLADAVVHEILIEDGVPGVETMIERLGGVDPKEARSWLRSVLGRDVDLLRESVESVVIEVLRKLGRGGVGGECRGEGLPGSRRGPLAGDVRSARTGAKDGRVVQRGRSGVGEEREEAIREVFERGVAAERMMRGRKAAGTESGGLLRLVEIVLSRPAVPWQRALRAVLERGLGRDVRRTWGALNRKLPGLYPGRVAVGPGEAWVLIDTSGSISDEELKRMLSEVYNILRSGAPRVNLVFWDAEVQGVHTVGTLGDLLRAKPRGGGGTALSAALRPVLAKIRPGSLLVVMSDWHLADPEEALELLREARRRGARIVVVAVGRERSWSESTFSRAREVAHVSGEVSV